MKNLLIALFLSSMALVASDSRPLGNLDALETQVALGTRANLNWKVTYPPIVEDFTPKTDVILKVKFITTALGPVSRIDFGSIINGGAYNRFYEGISEDNQTYALDPGTTVLEQFVSAGSSIDLLAKHSRTRLSNRWVSIASGRDDLVVQLKNGDPVPSISAPGGQRSVADILTIYSSNGFLNLGENEYIYLFELYTDNINRPAYDLQDMVLLVSYEQPSPTE